MRQALGTIESWIGRRDPHFVTVTPAHAVMDAYKDLELRCIFNGSGMTTPDGMAIVWLLKLRGYSIVSRVYGPDLMLETCRAGLGHEYRRFLYGGAEAVANTLAAISLCAEARTQYLFFLTLLAGPIQSGDGGLQQSP
jgi:N-acetylglucosaminyldiphosphoundecaprenol N-acetyl-beta-D-mannosaminyltransferase